jgi:hypothetical protein
MGRILCKRLFRRPNRRWGGGREANVSTPGSCPPAGFCINDDGPSGSATIVSDIRVYRYRDVQTPRNEDPKCLFMVAFNMYCVFSLCAYILFIYFISNQNLQSYDMIC